MKGRGALSQPAGRFETRTLERVDDGWERRVDPEDPADGEPESIATSVLPEQAKSIITRNDSPDIVFDQSINPYRGCEHGCVYCLDGATRILMGDGSQRALADIRVGDEIYGTVRRGHYRRYERTRVLAHWRSVKPAYRLRLVDGTELIASGDHRFLTERGWKFVAPIERPGQRPFLTMNNTLMGFGALPPTPEVGHLHQYRRGYLCGVIRGDGHLGVHRYSREWRRCAVQHRFRLALVDAAPLDRAASFLGGFGIGGDRFAFSAGTDRRRRMEAIRASSRSAVEAIDQLIAWPASTDVDWHRGFLAGIFDAEGSYSGGCIRIANTDQRIIEVITDGLRAANIPYVVETPPVEGHRPVHYVRIRGGLRTNLRFFEHADPAIARKRGLDSVAVKSRQDLSIAEIELLPGSRELYDITTGTGDFIANGVISHNCYARPSHAYVGLSPGLDFESRLYYKADAAALLEKELARPGYRCRPIMLGANTDPYQPIERRLRVTRGVLEVLARCRHPVGVITKGALVERDLDLLGALAREQLTRVMISLPTLDGPLKRILEPRAASVAARLRVIERLAAAGVPVGVMVAPVIPVLTDHEIERILEAAAAAGATRAGFIMLRLPYEVAPLFREWLGAHFPDSAAHVMSRVQDLRRGRDNDPCFGTRMSGTGAFATLVRQRFHVAARRLGMVTASQFDLPTDRFNPPAPQPDPAAGPQLRLPFG